MNSPRCTERPHHSPFTIRADLAQRITAIDDLPRLTGLVDLALAAGSVQDFLDRLGQW